MKREVAAKQTFAGNFRRVCPITNRATATAERTAQFRFFIGPVGNTRLGEKETEMRRMADEPDGTFPSVTYRSFRADHRRRAGGPLRNSDSLQRARKHPESCSVKIKRRREQRGQAAPVCGAVV